MTTVIEGIVSSSQLFLVMHVTHMFQNIKSILLMMTYTFVDLHCIIILTSSTIQHLNIYPFFVND